MSKCTYALSLTTNEQTFPFEEGGGRVRKGEGGTMIEAICRYLILCPTFSKY